MHRGHALGATRPAVVGFVAVETEKDQQLQELVDSAAVTTLKDRAMKTEAFQAFKQSIGNKVSCRGYTKRN